MSRAFIIGPGICFWGAAIFLTLSLASPGLAQQPATETPEPKLTLAPDIRDVKADLEIPKLTKEKPAAGKRVRLKLDPESDLYCVLYLPTNYETGKAYPVIVELAGNKYRDQFGDVSLGRPEGSKLGYGVSAGQDYVWVCVPFVTSEEKPQVATWWWGSPPTYDAGPTAVYCDRVVSEICQQYGGDSKRVVLAGFSRGAIACNLVGLHDDQIAKRWCGFIAFSHYDGVRDWDLPNADRQSAIKRLQRLGKRPQFICAESKWLENNDALNATRRWIQSTQVEGDFTFRSTRFRNHNDAWVLRPSEARDALRGWLKKTVDAVD